MFLHVSFADQFSDLVVELDGTPDFGFCHQNPNPLSPDVNSLFA